MDVITPARGTAIRVQPAAAGGFEGPGEVVWLMPQRCVYWPAGRTLLAADLHLGKAHAFQASGIPLTGQAQDRTLELLSEAIAAAQPERVLILGDLLHAPAGQTPAMLDAVSRWRRAHPQRFEVVPGNHDRRLEPAALAWDMRVHAAVLEEGPFAFSHEPCELAGRYTWCGHLHPAVVLRSASDHLKLPAFHVGVSVGVLPALSLLAAGGHVRSRPGDRVFAIAQDRVVQV